jgi:hypothetical protein
MKEGDKVVCIDDVEWDCAIGPKKGDIIKIRHTKTRFGAVWLFFYEYPETETTNMGYNQKYFRPVDYTYGESVIENLEKESIQITIEV